MFFGLSTFMSCESYFGDVNVDPENPTVVTPNVILPQVQARLAYTMGGDYTRYVGIYTQHVDGIGRQFAVIGNYGISGSDIDQLWANFYSGVLADNREMLALSVENNYNHFVGVSYALEAYSLMAMTDVWGDIPYSEAFQGTELTQPKFDSQSEIYKAIFKLLDDARTELTKDDGGFPLDGDLIYGGDASKWVKFCNTVEARGHLHLKEYQLALDALAKGAFESNADNAGFAFGDAASENSPWYQYIEQRDDCEVGAGYKTIMSGLSDARDSTYGFEHTVPGHPIFTPSQTVNLISYTEALFIKAECVMQTTGASDAKADYILGITNSFSEAMMADSLASYLTNSVVIPSGDISLGDIMKQKYIALYTSPEVFADWRRTGMPALSPVTGSQIPRRLPYALTEVLSNENAPSPADVTIFTPVGWDK